MMARPAGYSPGPDPEETPMPDDLSYASAAGGAGPDDPLAHAALAAVSDTLDSLVDLLADTPPARGREPTWVQVFGSVAEPHLVVLPGVAIPLGWTAPSACWATGLVAGGRTIPLDDPDEGAPLAVRVICLQSRWGLLSARLDLPDGSMIDEPPASGRLVDVLRRSFGLPTDAPPVAASHLLSVAWLDEIIAQADHDTGLTWRQVCAMHPCAGWSPAARPASWEDEIVAASRGMTWAELHRLAQSPTGGTLAVVAADPLRAAPDPHLARWMDTGMFARWLLSETPPLEQLRGQLGQVVKRPVASRVCRVLDRIEGTAPEARCIGEIRRQPNG